MATPEGYLLDMISTPEGYVINTMITPDGHIVNTMVTPEGYIPVPTVQIEPEQLNNLSGSPFRHSSLNSISSPPSRHSSSSQQSLEKVTNSKKPQAKTLSNYAGGFPWRSVSWCLLGSLLFSILLMLVRWFPVNKLILSTWEHRVFSSLTISFSSLVSLSVGSLLGLLGAALRWPLLAVRPHTPIEVDLLLSIGNPTVAVKLLAHCSGSWRSGEFRLMRWSTTALIVFAYLIVNTIGRLSVSVFGFSYDLKENVTYPIAVTDFGDEQWMQGNETLDRLGK